MKSVVRRAGRASFKWFPGFSRTILACSLPLAQIATPAWADDGYGTIRNLSGGVGLIDMPSAAMAPDGELSVGAGFLKNTQHYNFGFQILPWLEGDFRYTGLQHFDPLYPVYYDRSFAVKARLWNEGAVMPAVAVGVNDIVGTGAYGGEYVVATKHMGSVETTLGLGWGRLGSTATFDNPLTVLSKSFQNRVVFPDATPGATNFNTLFHGKSVGVFGGVSWATPIEGLSLLAEYSSDNYSLENQRGTLHPKNQINFGGSYALTDTLNLGLYWLYGSTIGASFSFALDPVHDPFPERLGPPPMDPGVRSPMEQSDAINQMRLKTVKATPSPASQASNGVLVDALWQTNGAVDDVALQGRVLVLTLGDGDLQASCQKAAALAARYSTSIEAVRVVSRSKSATCPVRVIVQPALLTVKSDTGMPAHAGLVAATATVTIDAAGKPGINDTAATAAIRKDMTTQSITPVAIGFTDSEATVYYSNNSYFSESDALERLARILMTDAPPRIEKFRLIAVDAGKAQQEFDLLRSSTEREFAQTGNIDFSSDFTALPAPMNNPVLASAQRGQFPRFSWSVYPQFRQQLFDPNNPFGVQLLAAGDASVELAPGWTVGGEAEVSLYDDFPTNRPDNSVLPHVRTDFLKYFTEGKNGLGALDTQYRFRLGPEVFAVAKAGYLESMFAGAGGEVLWRPLGDRLALGVDAYEVWQRDFDRLLGLQKYHVFTGHISLYYQSPWYGLNFVVRAGQYLAGDRGVTFEATRRFSTGVEVGAFFSKTNVSAQDFGEGSFDKGIIIRIPIGWALPINTQNQFNLDLRPVQRDGGQRLDGDATLYDETRRSSLSDIE